MSLTVITLDLCYFFILYYFQPRLSWCNMIESLLSIYTIRECSYELYGYKTKVKALLRSESNFSPVISMWKYDQFKEQFFSKYFPFSGNIVKVEKTRRTNIQKNPPQRRWKAMRLPGNVGNTLETPEPVQLSLLDGKEGCYPCGMR